MAETNVLIVAGDAEAGKAYAQAISDIGVGYDVATSFHQMADMATTTAYNGLIVDILTLVRSPKEEKAIAYDSINIYPVLRVKWDKREKKINLSPVEEISSSDAEVVLRAFIESRCTPLRPRRLRRHKRKELNLNLLVCTDEDFAPEKTIKTFTVTVSEGGVFLHSMQSFQANQRLWLRFIDFADQTPIPATVRWSLEWGKSRNIPGVGVKFEKLTVDQERELKAFRD